MSHMAAVLHGVHVQVPTRTRILAPAPHPAPVRVRRLVRGPAHRFPVNRAARSRPAVPDPRP
uniref:hypothetical protein n=1 Tax=Nocardia asiatica TaxID=209252 RepID=UPI001C3F1D29